MRHALLSSSFLFFVLGCAGGSGGGGGGTDGGTPPRDSGGTCGVGQMMCADGCARVSSDPANCGSCGNACGLDETCSGGTCRPAETCPPGEEDCGSGCIDTRSSDEHCGRCGNGCDATETCMDSSCQPMMCPSGQERCGAACTDTSTDNANCGGCDAPCDTDEMCMGGTCMSVCDTGETSCTVTDPDGGEITVCVNTQSDDTHCGSCGNACMDGRRCMSGSCACPTGTMDCGGDCVDTMTDPANCGTCGMACGTGRTCTSGSCSCPSGLTFCGGSCVNTATDNAHCGGCGTSCAVPAQTCVASSCMSACGTGTVMCGSMCVNPQTDPMNCGMCGRSCGGGTCAMGVCRPMNDDRTSAIAVTLPTDGSEATIMGSTGGATRDGPTISGCSANGPNVWYRVDLPTRGALWVDTAGSSYDTAIFITNSSGTPVPGQPSSLFSLPGICNDDCCGGTGDFTSSTQSCTTGFFSPGTYYISVGGYGTSSTGSFTLHVQYLPDTGFMYSTRLANVGTTTNTVLVGASEAAGMCASGLSSRSGEDMRWFASCGGTIQQEFSLCPEDGGTYERASTTGDLYDPVIYVRSGQNGMEVACDDDGPSTVNCRGTGGDSANFGSRLVGADAVTSPRGISAIFIDSRGTGGSGMNYSLHYDIPVR